MFSQLIVPILALDQYFWIKCYKKKFIELSSESAFESIDEVADNGIAQTEKTIVYHFQMVTEFTNIEKDLVNALKQLAFAPKFILRPFIITILATVAKISSGVQGNLRLTQSILLPFMKQVFRNNERHKAVLCSSAWARDIDTVDPLDIDKLRKVLIENNNDKSQEITLNGIIGLAFILLKTKDAPNLNAFGCEYLLKLINSHPELSRDIMKILVKMLFSEVNKAPIIDCFTRMILNRNLKAADCENELKELIEGLPDLDLATVSAIESVLLSLTHKSLALHKTMIEVMRTAIYQRNPQNKKMAIYSFCMMLRKVKRPSSASSVRNNISSQLNISMYSMITQSQLPSVNSQMRKVEILGLEILGILQGVLSYNEEIRVMMYDCLLQSIQFNEFIITNVMQMLEFHFRDYFDSESANFEINFERAFKQTDAGEFIVMDNLGKILNFFINCIIIATDKNLQCDLSVYRGVIEKLLTNICDLEFEQLGIFSLLDLKVSSTISQYLNCLEALMFYCQHEITNDNTNIDKVMNLFKKHQSVTAEAKKLSETCKKNVSKGKNKSTTSVKIPEINVDCIWDLKVCSNFLQIIFKDSMNEQLNAIKQNKEFSEFILRATSQNFAKLAKMSNHQHVKYSKAIFSTFCETFKILMTSLSTLKTISEEYSKEVAYEITEALKSGIDVMVKLFDDKWTEFLKRITERNQDSTDNMLHMIIEMIQNFLDWAFARDNEEYFEEFAGEHIAINLFLILEMLYVNLQRSTAIARKTFNWLLEFCKATTINYKSMSILCKVLFNFMMLHEPGSNFMESIAWQISECYGPIDDDVQFDGTESHTLNILTKSTVEQSCIYFITIIKRQIDDVEYFVLRMNSFNAHVKIPGQDSRNESIAALERLETSCIVKLRKLEKILEIMCNISLPLNSPSIELILRAVISFFSCLNNLFKHFCTRFDVKTFHSNALEELVKDSKKVSQRVYGLAPYVEGLVQTVRTEAASKNKNRKIPMKGAKLFPRLVLIMETFNKIVHKLDTLTKRNYSKYVYAGEVRDFRISNRQLQEACQQSQLEGRINNPDIEENEYARQMRRDSDDDEDPSAHSTDAEKSSDDDSDRESQTSNEQKIKDAPPSMAQFERNVRTMAKRGIKRKR